MYFPGPVVIDHGVLLLYKFGSLFYLFVAGIFCLDVRILHRYDVGFFNSLVRVARPAGHIVNL